MLTGTDTPERIRGASVSPNFFDTLGLTAVRGRTFLATDARPDADPTVVVSEAYWRRRGADPGLVGTEVTLQDRRRIIGVVSHAAALSYVSHATDSSVGRIDIWEPVAWVDTSYGRSAHFLRVIGRLQPQARLGEAAAEMETISGRLAEAYPESNPRLRDVTITLTVLALATSLSLLAVFAASLVPALRWSQTGAQAALGRAGHRYSTGRDRTRQMLVAAEVAASVVLLVAPGLLVRSFAELTSVDPGFQSSRVLTAQVTLSQSRYPEPQQRATFLQALIARVGALPAVEQGGAIGDPPLTGGEGFWRFGFTIEDQPSSLDGQRGYVRWISPGYFATMGIPLLQGRWFTEEDLGADRPQVVVVSQALVRQFFSGVDPIGQRVQTGFDGRTWREIVGVDGDVRQTALDQDAAAHLYYPYLQTPMPTMTLVVRSATDPTNLTATIRQAVHDADPNQPIHNVRTTEKLVAAFVAAPRCATALFGLFGVLALLLTVVGIYGVASYQVTQQTHDIAVRSALGASRRQIL